MFTMVVWKVLNWVLCEFNIGASFGIQDWGMEVLLEIWPITFRKVLNSIVWKLDVGRKIKYILGAQT